METLQPKLRFPEFDGDWELKQFKEITSLITKGTTPQNFSENGINFIKIECLNGHNIDTSKCLFIDEKTHTKELKRSILKEDDLLFAIAGATIGKCTVVTKEALPANTNQALAIIRLKEKENKDYIFQILTSEGMSKYIKDNISVGAQPNLNLEQINSFSFSYPSLEEQTRIANFLSAVDEKLNLLKEKKALLEEYKKGIMQKIFNQEIRFKDDNGNDFEEWEEKSLGDLAKLQGGYAFKSIAFKDEGVPIIRISNVSNKNNFIESNNLVFYDKILKDENFTLKNGDLLIAMSGATTGKSCIYNLDIKGYLNQRVGLFVNKNKEVLYYPFLIQYVFSIDFIKQLESVLVAGAQPNVSSSDIESFIFPLPSLREQTKIANFLSAIDEKIELVSIQIQDTQEYKKGLLQQMFI